MQFLYDVKFEIEAVSLRIMKFINLLKIVYRNCYFYKVYVFNDMYDKNVLKITFNIKCVERSIKFCLFS